MTNKDEFCFLEFLGEIDEHYIKQAGLPFSSYKKGRINKPFYTMKRIAAAALILLVLGAAVLSSKTAAAGFKRLTSAIARMLGFGDDTLSYTEAIGKTISKNGISITLDEVILGENQLLIAYEANTESPNLEVPALYEKVLLNGHLLTSCEGYSDHLASSLTGTREVMVYDFKEDYLPGDSAEIVIVWQPEVPDTSAAQEEYRFEFQASAQALKADTIHCTLNTALKIQPDAVTSLDSFTCNPISSAITGTCPNLPSEYQKYDVEFFLKGTDDLGNPLSYRMDNYSNPDVHFILEMAEGRISPSAASISLQLYGRFLPLTGIEGQTVSEYLEYDESAEEEGNITYDFHLDSYKEFTDNPFELFPIGDVFEIKIKD